MGGTARASGSLALTFLGHAAVLLDFGAIRVVTDPVLRRRIGVLRRVAPPLARSAYAGVDLVAISHLHHDHCDLPSLARLGRDIEIVAPAGAERFFRRHGFRRVSPLAPGDSYTVGPVTLTATPAIHDGRRVPFGPTAAAVGYLITTAGAAIYFAGDTDLFDAMRDLCPRLDLALLPVWGWGPNLGPGHLDPRRAAEAVARLRPRRAVPVHWGTFFPYHLERLYPDRLTAPPSAFARAVAARDLPTEVSVVSPGGSMTWHPCPGQPTG